MSLLSWLTATQQKVRQVEAVAKVTVVLGNMAADLDSGVSSLVLAYHRANIKGVNDISRNTMLKECTALPLLELSQIVTLVQTYTYILYRAA